MRSSKRIAPRTCRGRRIGIIRGGVVENRFEEMTCGVTVNQPKDRASRTVQMSNASRRHEEADMAGPVARG